MDRHVVTWAQEHHVLDAIFAAPADPVRVMPLAQRLLVKPFTVGRAHRILCPGASRGWCVKCARPTSEAGALVLCSVGRPTPQGSWA
jgi:hypothetical protein